jgi:deoxyribodipyrimidine photo-lyase
LIFELRWRDFFRLMMLKHGKSVFQFQGFGQSFVPPPGRSENTFRRWAEGKTGQPFVDAAMRELKFTGFMSNRMRQVVASYLIDYLKLDWRLGAAWFEEQLIDYDVSSNWCNWAYQAGVGNDPRGKRVFNPERQAEMYDPDGAYRRLWC